MDKKIDPSGATSQGLGIVRCYHESDHLTKRALVGYEEYRRLSNLYKFYFEENGFLYFQDKNPKLIKRLNWLKDHDYSCQYLEREEGRKMFPQFQWHSGAVYEPKARYYLPVEIVKKLITKAINDNSKAEVREERLRKLSFNKSGRITVGTDGKDLTADYVILSAGAWTPELLKQLNINDTQTFASKKIQQEYIKLNSKQDLTSCYPSFIDSNSDLYGRPDFKTGMLRIGASTDTFNIDPDQYISCCDGQSGKVKSLLPDLFSNAASLKLDGGAAKFDCFTRNSQGALLQFENGIVVSGFSGGGFKVAPSIAKTVLGRIKRDNRYANKIS